MGEGWGRKRSFDMPALNKAAKRALREVDRLRLADRFGGIGRRYIAIKGRNLAENAGKIEDANCQVYGVYGSLLYWL